MMLRTTAKALAASAAFLAPPVAARAQTQPSEVAVGVSMVQWAMLYCETSIIPPRAFEMVQTVLPLIPAQELELAFSYIDASLEEAFNDDRAASCAFLAPYLADIR